MNRIQRASVTYVSLVVLSVCAYGQGEKVLHFPSDRSVGKVFIQYDGIRREIKSFHYWADGKVVDKDGNKVDLKKLANQTKNTGK